MTTQTLIVTDPKGVSVSTWKPGEGFIVARGERIERNASGQTKANGKLLNLPAELQNKLLVAQRVRLG